MILRVCIVILISLCSLIEARSPSKVQQAVTYWCVCSPKSILPDSPEWSLEKYMQVCKELSLQGDLVPDHLWHTLKENGLINTMASPLPEKEGDPPFKCGWDDTANHAYLMKEYVRLIDKAIEYECPAVIAFWGDEVNLCETQQFENCMIGLSHLADHVEAVRKKTGKPMRICLEPLNDLINKAWKGHPNHGGNDFHKINALCDAVNQGRETQVLFFVYDAYHAQILHKTDSEFKESPELAAEGILKSYHSNIGHVQLASDNGRRALDAEEGTIDEAKLMRLLLKYGYQGWVAHEFIPRPNSERTPYEQLRDSVKICDVSSP